MDFQIMKLSKQPHRNTVAPGAPNAEGTNDEKKNITHDATVKARICRAFFRFAGTSTISFMYILLG